MSLREKLNQPAVGGPLIGLVVVVAIVLLFLVGRSSGPPPLTLYYTVDNGATYFAAPAQAAPFTYQGKEAYEVALFQCQGGPKFVGYMKRYAPSAHEAVNAAFRSHTPVTAPYEIRGPQDTEWTATGMLGAPAPELMDRSKRSVEEIEMVKCPDGVNYAARLNAGG